MLIFYTKLKRLLLWGTNCMIIDEWFRKKKSNETVERILRLLKEASKIDKDFQVFCSGSHKYKLNECASGEDVAKFEKRYNITLPDDYKIFLTQMGNGGAGPYYGMYPLKFEKCCHEYEYASRPCKLFPHMKLEDWKAVLRDYDNMDDDATDEEYDRLYNRVWL